MAHFVLAWELGGGLGHVGRLLPLARALAGRGHRVTLLLRDLVQTAALLTDAPGRCLQAPFWSHQTVGLPAQQASMAEILLGCGYLDGRHLAGLARGWTDAFAALGADAVVADYAPTAVLAARAVGVPAAVVGTGFCMPPDEAPLPSYRPWEPLAPGRLAHAEARGRDAVNVVLAAHGAPPVPRLAAVLRGDLPLLCTWAELDHYTRTLPPGEHFHGPSLSEGEGAAPAWPAATGPRAFAYVKAGHPDHAAALRALDASGFVTLCYLPEVAAGRAPPVAAPRLAYAAGPVDLTAALPGCAVAVCHGGEAVVARALLSGVPVLVLPMQAEQFVFARNLERHGLGINAAARGRAPDYAALVRALRDDPGYAARARAFAAAHAGFSAAGQTRAFVDAFETLAARFPAS